MFKALHDLAQHGNIFPLSLVISNRQNNLDTHVFPPLHNLAIGEDLVCPDPVADCIGWIRTSGNLNLAPLPVGRHQLSLSREALELLVDALLLDAAVALNERRICSTSAQP
jgi:hypothetical protein